MLFRYSIKSETGFGGVYMEPLIEFVQQSDDITGVLIIIAIGVGGIFISTIVTAMINFWRYIMRKIRPDEEILQFPMFPELIEYYETFYKLDIDEDKLDEMEE